MLQYLLQKIIQQTPKSQCVYTHHPASRTTAQFSSAWTPAQLRIQNKSIVKAYCKCIVNSSFCMLYCIAIWIKICILNFSPSLISINNRICYNVWAFHWSIDSFKTIITMAAILRPCQRYQIFVFGQYNTCGAACSSLAKNTQWISKMQNRIYLV